jgi:hypothetical protein
MGIGMFYGLIGPVYRREHFVNSLEIGVGLMIGSVASTFDSKRWTSDSSNILRRSPEKSTSG